MFLMTVVDRDSGDMIRRSRDRLSDLIACAVEDWASRKMLTFAEAAFESSCWSESNLTRGFAGPEVELAEQQFLDACAALISAWEKHDEQMDAKCKS